MLRFNQSFNNNVIHLFILLGTFSHRVGTLQLSSRLFIFLQNFSIKITKPKDCFVKQVTAQCTHFVQEWFQVK